MTKERKEIKALTKLALTEWASIVRSSGSCTKCGSTSKKLNAHHLLSKKRYPQFLFEIENGLVLCWNCHRYFAHLDSCAFALWFRNQDKFGPQWVWITENWQSTEKKKWTREELENVIERLRSWTNKK